MAQESPKGGERKQHHIVVTPRSLVIELSEEHHRKAQECIEKNGEVRISLKEVSVSRLPETRLGDGVLID